MNPYLTVLSLLVVVVGVGLFLNGIFNLTPNREDNISSGTDVDGGGGL